MAALSDQFILTFDLKAKYLVDGFLLVQDLNDMFATTYTNWVHFMFQNYFVNVGDDPDGRNNPSCPDAPFMTIADDGSAQSGWVDEDLDAATANVWRYGTERPCNLAGRYFSIIADYTGVAATAPFHLAPTGAYEIGLCNLAVMGTGDIIPEEEASEVVIEEPILEPEPILPTFAEDLQPITVKSNEDVSWVLPKVTIGSGALVDVVVIPDLFLTNFIDYDAQS